MAFEKGQIANPKGRPKGTNPATLKCRQVSESALNAIIEQLGSEDEAVVYKAAMAILDRAWGKPKDMIELDADINVDADPEKVIKAMKGFTTEELRRFVDNWSDIKDDDRKTD